jgi:hypothetical protein
VEIAYGLIVRARFRHDSLLYSSVGSIG